MFVTCQWCCLQQFTWLVLSLSCSWGDVIWSGQCHDTWGPEVHHRGCARSGSSAEDCDKEVKRYKGEKVKGHMDKASKKNKKGRCALKQKGTQLASSAASPDIYEGWSHRHAMKRTRHVNITVKVTNWHARLHPKVCKSIGIAWVIRKHAW